MACNQRLRSLTLSFLPAGRRIVAEQDGRGGIRGISVRGAPQKRRRRLSLMHVIDLHQRNAGGAIFPGENGGKRTWRQ